ncbi:CUB domain-containing protein [Fibrobacter sp. UWT2]|uniref:InlB B-repeat-containing protein n=1 Tax=Fibrobacter sp. UWT2 TaxID=1896224 RepID=UPI00091A16BA|nr:CUB domain-containing protein [Fibrobacter sp. UWT2]SHK49455.1 CUB domain-containing protein [Fibrobacter sp. UWT2]
MKKNFHVFFVFALLALLAAPSAAYTYKNIYLSSNGETVVLPCDGTADISASDIVRNFVIYDDGGASGNYSNNCRGVALITAPKGYGIKAWGWMKAESADSLHIKDDRYNTYMIAKFNGTGVNSQRDFGPYYSTCDGMNISFITDGSVVGPGFELHVEFVPLRTVSANSDQIWLYSPYKWGYYITETWGLTGSGVDATYSEGMTASFSFNPNYNEERVWGVKLRKKDGSGIVGYRKNERNGRYEFVMPSSDVGVVTKLDWDSAGYNMFNDEKSLFLYGTRKIKLYDEGGPEDDYASSFDGWLKLSTPEGFYFQVTGTVETEPSSYGGYDYLEIYDGEVSKGTSATPKCKVYTQGNKAGKVNVPSNCVSTAEYMTIHFRTDGSITAPGLDLTVSSLYRTYSVNVKQTSNGSISSDAYSSQKGSKVTLTVKPNSGYVLKGVEVVNKTTGFSYTYGSYQSNTVTFSMPASDVDVTPTFVKDTYSITKKSATGGSVTGPISAKVGSTVAMTTSTTNGYLYSGASVKVDGSSVSVFGEKGFLDGKFSFTMPIGDVTVTPSFTNDWSAEGGLFINMTKAKNVTAEIPSGVKSFKVYDDGGKYGDYGRSNRDTLVLYVPTGHVLQLSGSMNINSSSDSLLVYNGSRANAYSLLGTYKGSIENVLSTSNYMTLVFHSGTSYYKGLDLTVKVLSVVNQITYKNNNSGGSVTSDAPTTARNGYTVNYSYSYNSGYMVSDIKAVDADGKNVTVTGGWYNNNKASFKMPLSAVTVTSSYTNNWSAEGDLYINMPKASKVTATIPSGVKSFKVYDDGGKSESYSGSNRDTLVLNAPAGYVLQLSGTKKTASSNDSLLVYNGSGANANSLLETYKSYNEQTISNVVSTGSAMTLVFHTGYSRDYGLNLTVKVIPIVHQITYTNRNSGGSVTSDAPKTGTRDAFVNFSYSYNSGYLVKEIKAVTADGDSVAVTGGWYNEKNASFKMPLAAVTVTSTYTDDLTDEGGLYINMRKSSRFTATIPEGVKSFKVYDDGGNSGNYSGYNRDTLVLKAPDGYVLRLSGSKKTNSSSDSLLVYNGSGANANSLLKTYKSSYEQTISNDLSSGNYMTLVFHSGYSNYYGLDLTVKVISAVNQITYTNKNSGGSVTSDAPKSGKKDSIVSFSYSYNSGYMVKEIKAVSADGDSVIVTGGWYNDKKASFKMPLSAVTVTSSYTDDLSAEGGLYVNMRKTSKFTATIPEGVNSFKVYDDGGNSGNYSGSNRDTLVLKAPDGYVLRLSGNKKTASSYDSLLVYNGSGANANSLLKTYKSSYEQTIGNDLSSGSYMTLVFHSGSSRDYGLNLTVQVISAVNQITYTNKNSGGSVTSGAPTTGKDGSTVNYTYSYDSGYMVSDITAVDADGKNVTVTGGWYNNKRAFFKMPLSAVTITSSYTDIWSADGGLYINMLKASKVVATIPKGVESFKVYDDGGISGNYSGNNRDTLVLKAPDGYVLQLTGTKKTASSYDSLLVYNGSGTNANSLLKTYKSSYEQTISNVLSSGNYMTLVFHSGSSRDYGLDLKVTLILVDYAIQVNSATNGKVSASKTTELHFGDTVSLTASANTGYMLKDVVAKDSAGNAVKVTQYSFDVSELIMPAKNLVVTPTFTNNFTAAGGLHLDMRRNANVKANIPSGVKSLKVYDNGGKDGVYEASSNDTLTLTAPEGYRIKLTGNVKTEKGWDYFYVFDGENASANNLLTIAGPATYNSHDKDTSLTAIYSTGNHMTLCFKADGIYQFEGLDLTVTLEKINYTITRNSVTGGTVNGKDADTLGAVVYLTGSPTGSYHLSNVTVVDEGGNIIKSPIYLFDRSKFTMPASNVTVTPTWTDNLTAEGGLHLDLLKNEKINEDIPAGVKSFNLYDNGGAGGNYASNSRDTLTLNAPTGFYLVVTGSVTLEKGCDSLYIFDGVNTSAAQLFGSTSASTGSKTDIGTITSSGRSLTFRFKSDVSKEYSGLNLKVSVEPITYVIAIADAANGRVSSSVKKAAKDSIVNLSWVYTTGYLIRDIDVKDASENKIVVNGGWYSGAKASFTMPESPVIVTPTFTNNLTAEGDNGLYINMPKTGMVNATIPNKVTSFKVYDDGGASGLYSNGCNGTLVLNAPEGYMLQLSGSVTVENPGSSGTIYDYLIVYDGADNSATKLVDKKTGSATISAVRSSGRNLTLFFHSDGSNVRDGLDLTVTLVPVDYTVTVATVTGGSMTSDKESAVMDGVVTLTAVPKDGYLIDGVEVKDANNNVVALNNDIYWYCGTNKVSFKMPSASVTVTPKFSPINALYVNMPKKSGVGCDVHIPENVTSFKIYDDGGEAGNYSNNVNGELWVVFDEKSGNAGLKLSGTVSAPKDGAHLYATAVTDDAMELFYTNNGSSDGLAEDIGTFINSSSLIIEFRTGNVGSGAGLDLKVDVVKSPGAGVKVVYDDAHVIGDGKLSRWASITDGDKTSELNIPEDVAVDTITLSRNFKTNNVYNTILFPFDVKADSLDGVVKVLRFNGFKQKEDESWVVRMKRVWTKDSIGRDIDVNANTPYLVVMDDPKMVVRGGVTLRKTVEPIAMAEDCNWKFIGTLSYQEWPEGNPLVYGFSNNQFVKAGTNVRVGALRAYLLKPKPKLASERPSLNGSAHAYEYIAPVYIPDEFDIVEDDDENGENTTVIGRYNTRTGEFRMLPSYDIKGRKLNGKPNVHKAYYGKKIIRK